MKNDFQHKSKESQQGSPGQRQNVTTSSGESKKKSNQRRRKTTNTSAKSFTKSAQGNVRDYTSSGQNHDMKMSHSLKAILKGAVSSCGAQFTSGLGNTGGASDNEKPGGKKGEFDIFLLAQTWAPRFCCTESVKCVQQGNTGVDDLTLHGLWPAYSKPIGAENRTYPAYCTLGKDRKFSSDNKLMKHEYLKHGSCTGFSFDEYIDEGDRIAESEVSNSLRDFLHSNSGNIINVNDIYVKAGGPKRVAVQATPMCQLQELTTCWEKTSEGKVGNQVDCPLHVLGSGRNSSFLNNCSKVSLEASSDDMKCAFISKELLKVLKSSGN